MLRKLLLSALALASSYAATLEIKPGDHICLIGNTLAERMQFEGHNYWETLLHQRFPMHHLVVRNLAWPADEVVLRPRAEGFGAPDEHLTFSKADVVIAFFGFNESFAGEAGLEKFKTDLEDWIKHTKEQSYNGKGAPRIALVSPIAAEDLHDPNLPTGEAITKLNAQIELYTKAMKEIAEKNGVVFADVLRNTLDCYKKSSGVPNTINGVHLNSSGDEEFGPILDQALFGELKQLSLPVGVGTGDSHGKWLYDIKREIEAKSKLWYHRYRIIDSYYVYGGRSGLKFADGDQTNRDVMQREREVLDQMCANRDARIWALVEGKTVPEKCDDSNVPPFLSVQTSFGVNRKTDAGANTGQTSKTAEGDSADILPSTETLKKFKLAPGYQINLYASDEQFPELANAVSLAFDTRGRMFCTTMPSYPQWRPGDPMDDKIVILDDSDHDGKADYCNVFAGGLQCPISLEMANGGVLASNQRELMFFKDTNGDDKADIKEVMLSGFDSADSHHNINAFTYGPGGDLNFQEGTFHHTQVETPYGPVRCKNAGTYRYEPRTQKLDVFVSYNYANPHGIAFDEWGQTFISDASGGANYFATAFSGHLPYPEKHTAMKQWFPKRVRPTAGCEFVSSRNFPEEAQGRFLLNNCIGVQGVLQHKVKAVGSGYEGEEIEPLVLCDDRNFRPVDLQFGPDGALYIVDWQDALVGHMQYSLRDPQRDHKHARIWRVTYKDRPLVKPPTIAGEPIEKLLELLKEPEIRTRERVKQELSTRPTKEVMAALEKWIGAISDGTNSAGPIISYSGPLDTLLDWQSRLKDHALLEALWVCQWHNVINDSLLRKLLDPTPVASKFGNQTHTTYPDPRARAAAVRVLCYWRDRVPNALALLMKAANDDSPLVRLEAVRAASFFGSGMGFQPVHSGITPAPQGNQAGKMPALNPANVALAVLNHEMDYYLEYTLGETMRALKPSPKDIDVKSNPKALAYVLDKMTNDELKTAPREAPVLVALLERTGIDAATRGSAADDLAKLRKTTREVELAEAIKRMDEQEIDTTASADLGKLLASSPPASMKPAGDIITRQAFKDHGVRSARVAAMAAYVTWTQDPAKIWKERSDNHETLAVLMDAAQLISDPAVRAKFQPLIGEALNSNLPDAVYRSALLVMPLTGEENAKTNFGHIAGAIVNRREKATAARAGMQLPRSAWDKNMALIMVENIVADAESVPVNQRTQQDYAEITGFAKELTSLLNPDQAKAFRKALRELGVSVFVIKTVREQMRYDTPQLVVEAGKPFEVIFENNDVMPHNLVFCRPNTHTAIGTLAQSMPAVPDAKGYLYIPKHDGILGNAYTRMIEPGQKTKLEVKAPTTPGDYEYVCTFPGHWVIMFGKLIVVKDVDAYLAK